MGNKLSSTESSSHCLSHLLRKMDETSRFDSLLKPIRDLAENWSIDIARELEDYLDELGEIQISFGGDQSLNFAEAALLIQGSVCIYGKKVEYLHALVFKVMEMLAEKKAMNEDGEDGVNQVLDHTADNEEEADDDLPPVQIKIGKDLELDSDMGSGALLSRVGLLPVPPIELLALEHDEEYATSHSDQEYRLLNNCAVHRCGAILLDEAQRELLDDDLFLLESGSTMHMGSASVHVLPTVDLDDSYGRLPDPLDEVDDDDDDEIDEDGDVFNDPVEQEADHQEGCASGAFYPQTPNTSNTPMSAMTVAGLDPWTMLDPYTDTTDENRPFRFAPNPRVPQSPMKFDTVSGGSLQLPTCPQSMRTACFSDLSEAFEQELRRRKFVHRKRQNLGSGQRRSQAASVAVDDEYDDMEDVQDLDQDDALPDMPEDDQLLMEVNEDAQASSDHEDDEWVLTESQKQVNDFFQSSQAYAQETELSQRIGLWTDRMEPLLVEQNCRPVFDMQIYGERILTKLESDTAADTSATNPSSFKALTSDCEVWDVCRLFLSSLQLAADRNIDIVKSVADGVLSDDFGIKVLSLEAHRPSHHMDTQPDEEAEPIVAEPEPIVAQSKGLRFASASPVICETYGADVYDRAYNQSPSSYVENNSSSASQSSVKSIANSVSPDAKRARKSLGEMNA